MKIRVVIDQVLYPTGKVRFFPGDIIVLDGFHPWWYKSATAKHRVKFHVIQPLIYNLGQIVYTDKDLFARDITKREFWKIYPHLQQSTKNNITEDFIKSLI